MVKAVLHLGAHRCATTTFQTYLDINQGPFRQNGIAVWTPQHTRNGLFDHLFCQPGMDGQEVDDGIARVRDALANLREGRLLVSEENMIGAPRDNIDSCALYPGFTPRLYRFKRAFAGQVSRIGLSIRSYEAYWSSLLSFAVWRGLDVPEPDQIAALSAQHRSWRHIIAELRDLFPATPIQVWPFEAFANKPHRQFNLLMGPSQASASLIAVKKNYSRDTHNLRRLLRDQGRGQVADKLPRKRQAWMPFTPDQQARMQASYANDINWLRESSDPYLRFTEKAAVKVPRRPDPGGQHGFERQMGRTGQQGTAWQTP